MSSVKSSSSAGDSTWRDSDRHDGRSGEIVKRGYLKKLKTMRKKYFVLRGESVESSARLEYYDSEKKWRSHHPPKRSILLKTCFNINRRQDTKHKYVIALYTKDDCFCVVLESEEELEEWLKSLLSLQQGEDIPEGEQPKPTYEHVWQVTVKEKGLGNSRNILGPFLLCLTDKTLSLVQCGPSEDPQTYEFPLNGIRRCGYSDCFFYMEVGRSSCTGAGDLWMQTEDTNIAQNMHDAILHAMSSSREDSGSISVSGNSRPRTRSSPGSDAARPCRRQGHTVSGKPPHYSAGSSIYNEHHPPSGSTEAVHNQAVYVGPSPHYQRMSSVSGCPSHHPGSSINNNNAFPSQRRHSVSAMCVSPATPVNHQRTYSFPLSDDTGVSPAPSAPAPTPTPRGGRRSGAGITAPRIGSTGQGRERCDSLPSRARTTSEGHPQPLPGILGASRGGHLVPGHGHRPTSVYGRGISHSPPVGSSPVSPNSGACSTDSAGSSLSIDEGDGWGGDGDQGCPTGARYGTGHSLTPDEPAILEENCDDYTWTQPGSGSTGYSRAVPSLSLPIQGGSSSSRKISPNLSSSGFKSGSPSQGSYMDVYSPCSSSPLDNPGYMTMSPGGGNETTPRAASAGTYSRMHSRGSSVADDPYVPMGRPATDDGYVDMDSSHSHLHHGEMSPSSSCSVTSGTPSTDLRFSEYHLEKVSSYFTPSEDDDASSIDRPIRAYSVGSRADTRKTSRLEASPLFEDTARVRAFSVGSRLAGRVGTGRPRHTPPPHTATTATPGPKSSSAPLLSSSWSGTGGSGNNSSIGGDKSQMSDLMELDFTSGRARPAGSRRTLPPHREGMGSGVISSSPPRRSAVHAAGRTPPPSGSPDRRPRSPRAEPGHPPTGTSPPYVPMKPVPGTSPKNNDNFLSVRPGSPRRTVPDASASSRQNLLSRDPESNESVRLLQSSSALTASESGISTTTSTVTDPYVPMQPVVVSSSADPYVPLQPGSSFSPPVDAGPYLDMRPSRVNASSVASGQISSANESGSVESDPYLEMKPSLSRVPSVVRPTETPTLPRTQVQSFPTTICPGTMPAKPNEVPSGGNGVGDRNVRQVPVRKTSRQEEWITTAIEEEAIEATQRGRSSDYVEMGGSSSYADQSTSHNPYVEMTPIQRLSQQEPKDYVEMGPPPAVLRSSLAARPPDYIRMQPGQRVSNHNQDYAEQPAVDISVKQTTQVTTSAADGYLPMQPGSGASRKPEVVTQSTVARRSAPLDTPAASTRSRDGYVEMSWKPPATRSLLDDYRPSQTQQRSAPIAITRCTPPKALQLSPSPGSSPFSSLRRQRRVPHVVADVPTPSGSVFPFSPGSPSSRPFPGEDDAEKEPDRKCAVDATGGCLRLSAQSPPSDSSASGSGSGSSEQPTPVNADYANCSPPRRPFSELVDLPQPMESGPSLAPRVIRARGSWGPGENIPKFETRSERASSSEQIYDCRDKPPVPPAKPQGSTAPTARSVRLTNFTEKQLSSIDAGQMKSCELQACGRQQESVNYSTRSELQNVGRTESDQNNASGMSTTDDQKQRNMLRSQQREEINSRPVMSFSNETAPSLLCENPEELNCTSSRFAQSSKSDSSSEILMESVGEVQEEGRPSHVREHNDCLTSDERKEVDQSEHSAGDTSACNDAGCLGSEENPNVNSVTTELTENLSLPLEAIVPEHTNNINIVAPECTATEQTPENSVSIHRESSIQQKGPGRPVDVGQRKSLKTQTDVLNGPTTSAHRQANPLIRSGSTSSTASADQQLHYVSLDLEDRPSERSQRTQLRGEQLYDGSSYAQIDFSHRTE
ncbi:insulin receptor substrate 1 [Schistocerca nitens]|uniref:insulin receptor substrate 1 n=1 Tax=Schistocerca nitens TaxID=7011 RepID=UPI002117F406|nr:insulin receptor substrate 1 [Schistocerca nitens]